MNKIISGGILTVLENLKVKNIIIAKQGEESENLRKLKNIIKSKKTNIKIAKKGDYIKIDQKSYIEILFPKSQLIEENILNNNSLVFKFCSMGLEMLFTGDIEEIAEKQLVKLYKNTKKLEADILKVAHHGSKSSTTSEFLNLVKPKIALIGVGKNNNFGHPNKIILERLENCGARIYRTDEDGEISISKNYSGKMQIKKHIKQ